MSVITDEEFIAAQDNFNNEPDEKVANTILRDIFWPYLNNLAFCTIRKILSRKGVISYYSTEDIDELTKDVVCKLISRYINSKKGTSRFYKKHHEPYRKDFPKAMVWNACVGTIFKKPKKEINLENIEGLHELYDNTFEDRIVEKLDNELYHR